MLATQAVQGLYLIDHMASELEEQMAKDCNGSPPIGM